LSLRSNCFERNANKKGGSIRYLRIKTASVVPIALCLELYVLCHLQVYNIAVFKTDNHLPKPLLCYISL
jgi:hypothetical protein